MGLVKLHIRNTDREISDLTIMIRATVRLRRAFNVYCDSRDVDRDQATFWHDGNRIDDEDATPEQLGLEDDAVIVCRAPPFHVEVIDKLGDPLVRCRLRADTPAAKLIDVVASKVAVTREQMVLEVHGPECTTELCRIPVSPPKDATVADYCVRVGRTVVVGILKVPQWRDLPTTSSKS